MNVLATGRRPPFGSDLARDTQLIEPDGGTVRQQLSADAQVALYARSIHSGQAGLVELVRAMRQRDGSLRMRSRRDPARYLEAGNAHALARAAAKGRGRGEELFVTPLPRSEPAPGKRAVAAGSVVWVDLDAPDDAARLRLVGQLRPHLWVASGAGHHLYWRLAEDVEPAEVEALNRRLCQRLGGDPACCDCGRIMRLPGSFNAKRGRWCRIVRVDNQRELVDPDAIRSSLPDPDPPRPPERPSRQDPAGIADDELSQINPPVYFAALCSVDVPAEGGMVRCPLPGHEDGYASCQVYPAAEQGWWCFGCSRGGRIYDLASLLEGGPCGRDLRGELFSAAREHAVRVLPLAASDPADSERLGENRAKDRPSNPKGGT